MEEMTLKQEPELWALEPDTGEAREEKDDGHSGADTNGMSPPIFTTSPRRLPGKDRSERFRDDETALLVEQVKARQKTIYGDKNMAPNITEAKHAWEEISALVSSFSGVVRTPTQCRKRYNDVRRRTKKSTMVRRTVYTSRMPVTAPVTASGRPNLTPTLTPSPTHPRDRATAPTLPTLCIERVDGFGGPQKGIASVQSSEGPDLPSIKEEPEEVNIEQAPLQEDPFICVTVKDEEKEKEEDDQDSDEAASLEEQSESEENYENSSDTDDSEDWTAESPKNKTHKCSECGKAFVSVQGLKRHVQIHTGEKTFSCSVCAVEFTQKTDLKKHMRTHTGERPFRCPVCAKGFSQKCNMHRHMKTHTRTKPFSCSFCEEAFESEGHLERHVMIHTGEKPFKCPFCLKGFPKNALLKIHLRNHTGEKPYQCSICAKSFAKTGVLKEHMKTHTIQKRYECSNCDQVFPTKMTLKKHEKSHKNEKPPTCPFCPMTFQTRINLKKHIRTHGDRPYSCSICSSSFQYPDLLRKHMDTHAFRCWVCKKSFPDASSLEQHMKSGSHITEEAVTCSKCGIRFNTKTVYEEHLCRKKETAAQASSPNLFVQSSIQPKPVQVQGSPAQVLLSPAQSHNPVQNPLNLVQILVNPQTGTAVFLTQPQQ